MEQKNLEQRIKILEHEVMRLQAVNEIQTLVGRYAVLHTPKTMKRTPELFALKQPDVSVEIAMWGVFIGAEQVMKMYHEMEEGHEITGAMFEHQFTTPMIEVAADGKTAKGVWFSPGIETPLENGKPVAKWCWGKYGGDFIREDGEWKIWHLHFYDTFMCSFYKSWVDTEQPPVGTTLTPTGLKADRPPTYRSSYFPTGIREPVPYYPERYKTWDGKSMAQVPVNN